MMSRSLMQVPQDKFEYYDRLLYSWSKCKRTLFWSDNQISLYWWVSWSEQYLLKICCKDIAKRMLVTLSLIAIQRPEFTFFLTFSSVVFNWSIIAVISLSKTYTVSRLTTCHIMWLTCEVCSYSYFSWQYRFLGASNWNILFVLLSDVWPFLRGTCWLQGMDRSK